jgi:hypothetical protein
MNFAKSMIRDRSTALLLMAFLSLGGIMGRLLPHEPNATPTAALGLVAGAALGLRMAIFVPIVLLLVTDYYLGTYEPLVMVSVYACLSLPSYVGAKWLSERRKPATIAICAAANSAVFFVVTNLAVWASGDWYERNFAGLIACYAAAIPFLRNMLTADLVWSGVLFAGVMIVESLAAQRSAAELAPTSNSIA